MASSSTGSLVYPSLFSWSDDPRTRVFRFVKFVEKKQMGNPLRVKTLASAVGFALVGLAFQPSSDALAATSSSQQAAQAEAQRSYLITFAEEGLLHYEGGVAGIRATAPAATGSRKLDAHSAAARAYDGYLATARANHLAAIEGVLGHGIDVTHHYAVTHNGVAATLTASEAAAVAGVPGVVSIKPAGEEHLVTYRGPRFIGADTIWNGTNTPNHVGTQGAGVLAAILDGGTNSSHPSFANDPACGFSGANPKFKVKLDCSTTNGAGVCNGPNPEANPGYGHGVHTSSTVAGNTIDNTVTPAPALPNGVSMSGVAPCASILHYKVCATNTCGGAAIAAGIDNAMRDGADVLNFSISGGSSPWGDNDRTFLDAVYSDVFVAAAAGNTREGDLTPVGKVNHRGPWVMTVAATTQDQIIGPSLSIAGPGAPPENTTGVALNPGSTTPANTTPDWTGKPMKSYPANIEGCSATGAFPAGTFTGSIAYVRRGTCPFTEKITNAAAAGAELVVIGNNQAGSINMDTTGAPAVPAYSTSQLQGDALRDFLAANTNATANVAAVGANATQGDVLANFSYRGPTPAPLADLTKPDISAPGVDIYAATDPTSGQYEFMSGTSMATPHVAGAAALIRSAQPGWSVTEVKSAMMSTSKQGGSQENGTTPWNIDDVGSGRVDLTKAALAGFTLDETKANFLAANPSAGGDVKNLNLPAIRNLNCTPECTFTRTVKNALGTAATWNTSFQAVDQAISVTVSPATFSVQPGQTQQLTITAKPPAGVTMSAIGFGYLNFIEANGLAPDQHFSVAIQGAGGTEPEPDDIIFKDGFDGVPGAFSENFDSYAAGSNVAGQGGWKGWGNDDQFGATVVDSISGDSKPNSIEIEGDSDLIHEFDYDSGSWTITINQYIPTDFTGESYYIFENVYDDADMGIISWSTQVKFDGASGTLANETGAANPFTAPMIKGEWVELKLVVDLDNDLQTFYYDGVQMYSGSWTGQFPGQTVPGVAKIGSIDLFANGASPVYYDDLRIVPTP